MSFEGNKRAFTYGMAFLLVGIGLLLCIPLGQTNGSMESCVVAACGTFSLIMGGRQLAESKKR